MNISNFIGVKSAFFDMFSLSEAHNLLIDSSHQCPFGMVMDGRSGASGEYRYGFQGQEMDDEVKGKGNSVNYKYRMHDPRIGRFFARYPLAAKYPEWTPYAFSGNQVTVYPELEGLEPLERVDDNGQVIQPEIGEERAGVPYGDSDKSNNWGIYQWQQTSTLGQEPVRLFDLYLNSKYDQGKVAAKNALPYGVYDVEMYPYSWGGFYMIKSFRISSGEKYYDQSPNGFWNSSGGMYSFILNEDGSYAGDLYTEERLTKLSHNDVINANLTYLDFVSIGGESISKKPDMLGLVVPGVDAMGVFWTYNNAQYDKKIRAALLEAGPGSYYSTIEVNWSAAMNGYSRPYERITHYYRFKGYYNRNIAAIIHTTVTEIIDPNAPKIAQN